MISQICFIFKLFQLSKLWQQVNDWNQLKNQWLMIISKRSLHVFILNQLLNVLIPLECFESLKSHHVPSTLPWSMQRTHNNRKIKPFFTALNEARCWRRGEWWRSGAKNHHDDVYDLEMNFSSVQLSRAGDGKKFHLLDFSGESFFLPQCGTKVLVRRGRDVKNYAK